MARSVTSGPYAVQTKETDGSIWIPATQADFFTGTWTKTRNAAGDIAMVKTAGLTTASNISFDLTANLLGKVGTDPTLSIGKAHDIRGYLLNSIDVVYKTATLALTTLTYDLHSVTYANGSPVAVVSTIGGTLTDTLTTAAGTTPRLGTITLGTPYVLGANTARVQTILELTPTTAATSDFLIYGIFLNVHYNLL